jgi:hypothetical protein
MFVRKLGLDINQRFQLGANLNLLSFTVEENQTSVGTITEAGATSFSIVVGASIFNINSSGVITFKSAPDYETQSIYSLDVLSNLGKRYRVSVYLADILSSFVLNTGTVLNLATAV